MNKNKINLDEREREKPKLMKKNTTITLKKVTIIIHMKHYHIKHFYFLIKSTVPV